MANHSNRYSNFITDPQAKAIANAAAHAWRIGFPLNMSLTIHLTALTVTNAQAFITALFNKHWMLMRPRTATCYVAVLEDGGRGLHLHAAVHVPNHRRRSYATSFRQWVKQVSGVKLPAKSVKLKTMAFSNDTWSQLYLGVGDLSGRSGLKGWIWYILKGVAPFTADQMTIKHVPQGRIRNKRCTWATCLGPAAIRKWRSQNPMTLPLATHPGVYITTDEAIKERMLLHAGLTAASDYQAT